MISTHILDTSKGSPAAGVTVVLQKQVGSDWKDLGHEVTNADGRASFACEAEQDTYRIVFKVEAYLKGGFYTSIPVVFRTDGSKSKYHIPLLLSPFGYSTYRGS